MQEPLPLGESIAPDEIQDNWIRADCEPFDDSALGFQALLPKDWGFQSVRTQNDQLNATKMKPLALFVSPEGTGESPRLQIQGIQLKREISAADWILQYSQTTDREITTVREQSPIFCDTEQVGDIEGVPFAFRSGFLIDGNRGFLIEAMSGSASYDAFRAQAGLMMSSFKLKEPAAQRTVEEWGQLTVGSLKVHAPKSWRPRTAPAPPAGKQAVDFYNLNAEEEIIGLIRAKCSSLPTESLMQARQLALEEFTEAGIGLGELLRHDARPLENFPDGTLSIHKSLVTDSNGPSLELWIYTCHSNSDVLTISLLTPAREATFSTWAHNKRVYEECLFLMELTEQ